MVTDFESEIIERTRTSLYGMICKMMLMLIFPLIITKTLLSMKILLYIEGSTKIKMYGDKKLTEKT